MAVYYLCSEQPDIQGFSLTVTHVAITRNGAGDYVCTHALYASVSVQAIDRFVQAFISPNLREKQLLL